MSKRSKFLRAAERLEHDSVYSAVFTDPFPDWCGQVVLRFARVFLPELKVRDVTERPETFFGHVAAFVADLVERAKTVKLSEIPRGRLGKVIRQEILSIRKVGPERLRELKRVVAELPADAENKFYKAYVESVENDCVTRSLSRLDESNTAKICFFLLCMRVHIEAGKFRSVSELLRLYVKFEELDPQRKAFFEEKPRALRNLEGQFRDICSEDGLKLRGKGRPRKILPAAA
jgi:hypothetical protein